MFQRLREVLIPDVREAMDRSLVWESANKHVLTHTVQNQKLIPAHPSPAIHLNAKSGVPHVLLERSQGQEQPSFKNSLGLLKLYN